MPASKNPKNPVLALDTASPLVSVAVAADDRVVAQRQVELLHSSGSLLQLVDEVLTEAGLEMAALAAVAVLRGPGSFTGLRVGLATALGFHQALHLPATAPSTFEVLAAVALAGESSTPLCQAPRGHDRRVAAVDALRDEWFLQSWRGGRQDPEGEPQRWAVDDLHRLAPAVVIGFGVRALVRRLPPTLRLVEPPPLAPTLARLAAAGRWVWDDGPLTSPLYLRAPAVHGG